MPRSTLWALALSAIALVVPDGSAMSQVRHHPLVRIAELDIDPVQLAAYKALLSEEIEASVRLEPGVLALNAVAVKGLPHEIRILEVYADQAAYEAHLKAPHFLKYKTGTAAMVRSLRLIETDPILLCAKASGKSNCG